MSNEMSVEAIAVIVTWYKYINHDKNTDCKLK